MLQTPKRTGRTSRLLEEARRLAEDGRAVYVVAADADHVKHLRGRLPKDTNIKVETPVWLGNFDWQNMRLRSAHPNSAVLVDHYAIECYWHPLLEMWQRFDETAGAVKETP